MKIPQEKIDEAKRIYGKKAMEEIVEYLGVIKWNDQSFKGSCPWHSDSNPSFIWNDKNNSFHCFGCHRNYGIIDLYLDQGMSYIDAVKKLFENTGIEYNFSMQGVHSKPAYRYPKHIQTQSRYKTEEYLKQRKISKKTLDYLDIQEDGEGNMVFHFYDENDVLVSVKHRPSHKIKSGEAKCWFQKNADYMPILFNMNRCDPSKPLYITEGECFKGDTEVLTPQGWVRLSEYNGQEVMQIDEELKGSFVKPLAYINKHYDGNMLYVNKGNNYVFDATENHNIVYIRNNKIFKRKASEMPKTLCNGYIPTTTIYEGEGIPLSNDQLALYLAISADCTIDVKKTVRYTRFTVKKDRKYLRLKQILDNLSIEYYDNPDAEDGYKFIGFHTPEWVESKILPMSWIYQSTVEQKRFILDEMVHWDGNRVPNRNQVEYSSKLYENALLIQTLAHTCGYMSTIMKRKNKYGEWYKVSVLYGKNHVSFQSGFDKKYHYDGMVYCVTVPTGMILVRQEEHIAVCGNCDCMALIECGVTNAVSVPNGCMNQKWIEQCWDWLEQFPKIIIWGDNDEPGIKARNEICSRLGTWRTYYVEINSNDTVNANGRLPKDANEVLYFLGRDKVLEYANNPIELPIEGVFDLANAEEFDIQNAEGLYTGIKELDNKIYKLVFGTLNIITGKSGEGKSVFVNQVAICQALDQGYDVFVYSGELPAPVLKNWVETNMIGREHIEIDDGGHVRHFEQTATKKMREWYSGRVMTYDDSFGVTATTLLHKMEEMARKFGTKVFLIDNLMMVDLECDEQSRLQAEKDFIKDLINFAKKFNVLVFLVAHPRKTGEIRVTKDDISGSSNIVNLAHMVFSVHRYTESEREGEMNERGNYKKGKEPIKYESVIEVLKNRITGLVPKVDVFFDYTSYRFYRTPEEIWHRYKWDDNLDPINTFDPNPHEIPGEEDSPLNDRDKD